MTPQQSDTNNWEYEAIRQRYRATHELELTMEQAKLVFDFEQLRDTPSDQYYFSDWEAFDFEFARFQKILTPDQFEDFQVRHQELVRLHEERIAQQDQEYGKQLRAATDLLQYYESILLPGLESQRMLVWQALGQDREKLEYLRAEYKKHLNNRKKGILVEHFRHSKTLQPQLLQLSLLNHKLSCLLPDYFSFRASMQTPTIEVADYLEKKLIKVTAMIMEELKDVVKDFNEFRKANTAKHLGEVKGWHFTIEAGEDSVMFLLLIDQEKYGC